MSSSFQQVFRRVLQGLLVVGFAALSLSCATRPPAQLGNLCSIFSEKKGFFYSWYDSTKKSRDRYGVPIPILMATVHQESRFRSDAKPPRRKLLWVIPWTRPSSAFGYAQVLDETWDRYKAKTGNWSADRDDFEDAVDFIGWYYYVGHKRNGIALNDPYHLYLSYHEGHGGFSRKTYEQKEWLKRVARKVESRSRLYAQQLSTCESRYH